MITGIRESVDDTYRKPEKRKHPGCPMPLALVYMAERFGGWPWEIENAPMDRVMFYLKVLEAESEAHADHEGLEQGEEVYRMED